MSNTSKDKLFNIVKKYNYKNYYKERLNKTKLKECE